MIFQTFNLLENIYFHIIIAPITLFGVFFILKYFFRMKWKSIELKVSLLIILTTVILVELVVLILEIFKDNIWYYLLSFTFGFSIFLYLLYFTIKSIIIYSNNLILAKNEIELSQKQYRDAYNNAELYKDVFTHDISNMLQNLTFSIDLLYYLFDKKKNVEDFHDIINNCRSQIKHGTELVSNVRLLSKLDIEELMLKPMDINLEIKELVDQIMKKNLNNKLKIEMDIENQKSFLIADNNLFHLFKNLILNGIIHNDNPFKEILIKIRTAEPFYDNHLRIEIIDNGRGLDPQLKENYIEFFSNDEINFRSGLGLLVVKKLISSYNGYIFIDDRIENDHTQGTKVIVYLPKSN